tara:strand:- start:585 stop:770 length:186 start_codon:yes stop_codon:yes gene_type:complete
MWPVVALAIFMSNQALYGRYKIMTDQEIIDLFDSNLNITLRELSNLSGRTIANLKKLLMGE